MFKKIILFLLLIIIIGVGYVTYANFHAGKTAIAPASLGTVPDNKVERGKYLAQVGDCMACHTREDGKPFAGGIPLETPFGKITPTNITPDVNEGIGGWTDSEFINAVKYGRAPGGRILYPAMPYSNFAKVSDEDILAIKAYLDSVEPATQDNPPTSLPFPFNIRPIVLGWNSLFLDKDGYQIDEKQSDEWNRGAYLVNGLAHCGMCHTPKNMLGADEKSKSFQGAVLQGWYAPEITSNEVVGIGKWSIDNTVAYLKTGSNARAFASGPMGEAIDHSLQYLNDQDLKAMVVYLKTVPGSSTKAPNVTIDAASMKRGEDIFSARCSACHGVDADGTAGIAPAFANSSSVRSLNLTNQISAVLNGTRTVATNANPTAAAMPSFGVILNDGDIASVLNYLRNSHGNSAAPISTDDVAKLRKGQK